MPGTAYQTVGDIVSAVIRDTKESSLTTGIVSQNIRWIQEGQEQLMLRKKREWTAELFRIQTIAQYTPNVIVTSGSTVVTLVSGSLPSTSANYSWFFKTDGFNEVYEVSAATSTTLTLANAYLGASSTAASGVGATIFQNKFLLDDEIETVYQVTHAYQYQALQQMGPIDFFNLKAGYPSMAAHATHFTLFDETNTGQRYMWVYPNPYEAYSIDLQATRFIPELTALSDEPVIPYQYRQALYHYCMMKMYDWHENESQKAFYAQAFNNWLMKIDSELEPTSDMPTLKVSIRKPGRSSGNWFFPINRITP